MCGFGGILGSGADHAHELMSKMMEIQKHRGPDGIDFFTDVGLHLGHVRLAILDLSDKASQPMSTLDGRYTIVFNGEIYNYLELRSELSNSENWKSESDTEVLLRAYQKWGAACLDKLQGMFAFAIWDHDRQELFLARDRFGIKPLYYCFRNSRFFFSSEIKPLLLVDDPSPDLDTVAEYLNTGFYDHKPATFFRGIVRLMPGHYISIKSGNSECSPVPYYNLYQAIKPTNLVFDDAKEQLSSLVEESIRIHMRSDVSMGVSVSGGVDSSALLSSLKKHNKTGNSLKGFSVDYPHPQYSERAYVDEVLKHTGTKCTFCMMDQNQILDSLAPTLWHQEEPFGGLPTLAWFSVYQQVKSNGISVLFDGSGVDDYLAGYQTDMISNLTTLFEEQPWSIFSEQADSFCKTSNTSHWNLMKAVHNTLQSSNVNRSLDGSLPVRCDAIRPRYRSKNNSELNLPTVLNDSRLLTNLSFGMTTSRIPRALRFKDKISMAFSCEMRVPFLDHKLVEFSLSLPESFMVRDGLGKYIFRESLRGTLPEDTRLAPKRHVQTPQREWFKNGPLAELMCETLDSPSDLLNEVVCMADARNIYNEYLNGDDNNSNYLWQWVNLDLWYKMFFESRSFSVVADPWPTARVQDSDNI